MAPRNRKLIISPQFDSNLDVSSDLKSARSHSYRISTNRTRSVATSRNAARERSRVRSLRDAFHSLQNALPSVPPDTKLSKLDVLVLASTYIAYLRKILGQEEEIPQEENRLFTYETPTGVTSFISDADDSRSPRWEISYLHPVKKWPMRSRLYAGVKENGSYSTSSYSNSSKDSMQWQNS